MPLTAGPSSSPVIRQLIEPGRLRSRQQPRYGGDEAGDRALHVDRAAAVDVAIDDLGGERLGTPGRNVARRHDVGVAGERDVGAGAAEAGVEVGDRRGARRLEGQAVAAKAEARERALDDVERPGVLGRDARAADQGLGERDRVGQLDHARSSSLIEVLARVLASTCLTITAQASAGPGRPASSPPGRVPGTTTE